MAVTKNSYTVGGSGQAGPYSYSFPVIADADIKVSVNGAVKTVTTHYTLDTGNTRITFVSGQEPSTGDNVTIYRDTDEDPITNTFVAGSTIRSNELNDNFKQLLYIAQESDNQSLSTLGGTMSGNLEIGQAQVIKFEGATANANEITLTVVDPTADRTITLPNVTGTVVTTGDTGTVARAMVADDAIDTDKIANNAVSTTELAPTCVTTAKIADTAVTTAKLADDCVTDGKIGDNAINSWHYVDGSIDTAHIADAQVTAAKLADNAVTTAKIADNAINAAKIAASSITVSELNADAVTTPKINNAAVTTAKLADNAVTTAKITDNAVNSAKIADGNITTTKIADDAVRANHIHDDQVLTAAIANNAVTTAKITDANITEAKLGANAVTTAKINGGAVTEAKLATSSVTTTRIADDAVTVDKIADGAVTESKIGANAVTVSRISNSAVTTAKLFDQAVETAKIDDTAVTTAKIADNAVTTAKLADAELTTLAGMQSGTASVLASSTALTSTTAELNLLDGKSIVTTISGSPTDVQIPTAQAVDERITTVVTDVGGFVPIANETSFPSTNPDINDGAGTIVSIKALASAIVCGSGVTTKTIANGAGSGNTVTINGLAQNTTYPAGRGMLVETTSTLHTYTYHRLTLDESGVADAQTAVDDFNARYRVASSAPSSSLDDGDLYFDTSVNKMKVYNASSSSWDDVAAPGDFYIATFSQSFDNSRTAFTVSNAPTSAQQLLISINGVIQKPNAGTGQPSEGFTLSGSTVTFSSAPATGSDYYVVVLGSSVNIGTPSDNTVATAKIQNGAVTEEKLSISNGPQNGYFLQTNGSGTLTWAEVDLTAATDYADNVKVRWGTGNDLQIYHDGSNSYIHDGGIGQLRISSDNFKVYNQAQNETIINGVENGAVSLYYDNSLKLHTGSDGISVTGVINNQHLRGGSGDMYVGNAAQGDLYIYVQDNTNNSIILQANTGEKYLEAKMGGAVDLYHHGSKKFETTNSGCKVTGQLLVPQDFVKLDDNVELYLGNGNDLSIYHNGTDSVIDNDTGALHLKTNTAISILVNNSENAIVANANAETKLYYDNSAKFETYASGIKSTGHILPTADNTYNLGASGATWAQINVGDHGELRFGNGQDLKIRHDGTDNHIASANGNININVADTETAAVFKPNGNAELYYDNAKKLETTSDGVWISGNIRAGDDAYLKLGASGDLQIYHDGSNTWFKNTTGQLKFETADSLQIFGSNSETLADFHKNGACNLFYDNFNSFSTDSHGVYVKGPEGGSGYIYLYADEGDDNADKWNMRASSGGSHFYISNLLSGSWENNIQASGNGAVYLYYDASAKLQTESFGVKIFATPRVDLESSGNSVELKFIGNSSSHRGSIYADNGNTIGFLRAGTGSWAARWHSDGKQTAHGHIHPNSSADYDLGSSSLRWRNIYSADLQLSNEGSANEVDGTWGNFTIQEGEDDLFLINRRNGKKYKFNLTEVN